MFLKRIKKDTFNYFLLVSLSIISIFSSCSNAKRVPYFKNIPDSLEHPVVKTQSTYTEPRIQSNDILFVSIQTLDDTRASGSTVTSGGNGSNDQLIGYTVDRNGYIELPMVGKVKVDGLTTTETKEVLREKASKNYVDPVVNVKFMSMYANVLGDVGRPGRVPLPNEKVSIIDAISLAGDLTISGKRENVLLIREENGEKVFVRLNLNNTDIFKSPYYYLRSGDVVYVEPNKAKARTSTTDTSRDRYIGYVTSIISLGVLIYTVFANNN